MIEMDGDVGKLLKALDDFGIADRHDRCFHDGQWPEPILLAGRGDHAVSQREELELGRRLPRAAIVRWPGKIKAGEVSRQIFRVSIGFRRCSPLPATRRVKDRLLKGWQPDGK